MKIICMTGTPVHLNYLVNTIAAEHEIALVIREQSLARPLQKVWKKGLWRSMKILLKRFAGKASRRRAMDAVLGGSWRELRPDIPVFETENINSAAVAAVIAGHKPDLVVVQGTSLIRGSTIAGVPLVLNIHWGLSPYYKGSFCTEWALINNDPYNIGCTIHHLSAKIDGGAIVSQARVVPDAQDTAYRINMKLSAWGAQKMTEIITRLKAGETLPACPQDPSAGTVYLVRQWKDKHAGMIRHIERHGGIAAMLEKPSRAALPIIGG